MNSLYDIYDYAGMRVEHGSMVGVARLVNMSDGDTEEHVVYVYNLRVKKILSIKGHDGVLAASQIPSNRVVVVTNGSPKSSLLLYKMETVHGVCCAIVFRKGVDDPITCVVEFF